MRLVASAVVIAAACVCGACASGGAVPRPFPGATVPPTPPSSTAEAPPPADAAPPPVAESSAAVVRTALALRGTPYRNGGSDPAGFDCSGLVQWAFNQHGVHLPREVRDQFRIGEPVDLTHVEPGDLLFFQTVSRGPSHVGIAIGGGEFVHAPSSRGVVRIERYGNQYWASRFIAARRVGPEITRTD